MATFVRQITVIVFGVPQTETAALIAAPPTVNKRCVVSTYVLTYSISFFFLIYGAMHVNDCPLQKILPIIWIFLGICMLLLNLLTTPHQYERVVNDNPTASHSRLVIWSTVICCIVIFCLSCVQIYFYFQADSNEDSPDSPKYCDSTFYNFNAAFGIIGALCNFFIFIGVALCILMWIFGCVDF